MQIHFGHAFYLITPTDTLHKTPPKTSLKTSIEDSQHILYQDIFWQLEIGRHALYRNLYEPNLENENKIISVKTTLLNSYANGAPINLRWSQNKEQKGLNDIRDALPAQKHLWQQLLARRSIDYAPLLNFKIKFEAGKYFIKINTVDEKNQREHFLQPLKFWLLDNAYHTQYELIVAKDIDVVNSSESQIEISIGKEALCRIAPKTSVWRLCIEQQDFLSTLFYFQQYQSQSPNTREGPHPQNVFDIDNEIVCDVFDNSPLPKPIDIHEKITVTRISLKSLLDAQDGIERLRNDINQGQFIANGLQLNKNKFNTLLDILRVAAIQDEVKIMQAIEDDDPEFYHEISQLLFSENMIPYLNTQDILSALQEIPDDIRATLFFSPFEKIGYYRKFFSKNNYLDLKKFFEVKCAQTPTLGNQLWPQVIARLTSHKKLTLYQNSSAHQLWPIDSYPNTGSTSNNTFNQVYCQLRWGEFLTKNTTLYFQNNQVYRYSESSRLLRIAYIDNDCLVVMIPQALRYLQIIFEVSSFQIVQKEFHNLLCGILLVKEIPATKHKIFLGGADYSLKLHEGIYIRR